METTKTTTNHRARWAAIGAAVAVSLGAGGLGIAQATVDSGPMNIYQAIAPCRLADTRPAPDTVGARTAPLGADETYTLDGWGAVGNCTLPTDIAALELNVTAIGATDPTFLTLFPAGGAMPTASNLNPVPGEPPTPNSVTVTLAADGKFSIYNLQGSVNVIVDVVGYYEDHNHTGEDIVDGSLTAADVLDESLTGADIDDHSVSNADTSNEPGIARAEVADGDLTTTDAVVASVAIQPPSAGFVTVSATFDWFAPANQLNCQITDGTTTIGAGPRLRDTVATPNLAQSVSIERTFEVDAYSGLIFAGQTFNLVCRKNTGTGDVANISMTATFFASEYEPLDFVFVPITLAVAEGEQ